jgi:hypothetical protein
MMTPFHKDVMIADLHRKIYEAHLLGTPKTAQLRHSLKEHEHAVEQLEWQLRENVAAALNQHQRD